MTYSKTCIVASMNFLQLRHTISVTELYVTGYIQVTLTQGILATGNLPIN